ncbi:MAG TPA: hypothetical protein ENK05_01965 [Gammaproteobacteria bacterium]|nr:hypothetical protein [Gammaproteobacteria bacterium]
MTRALAWCAELVSALPPSAELDSRSWRSDPLLRAFFSSVDDLREVLGASREVRDFFASHPSPAQRCHAMLSAVRSERTVLGSELQGDVMRRDVKQRSVSFGDRRLVRPAASDEELHRELEDRAFEVLVGYVLERIAALLASRHSLEERRSLLEAERRLARTRKAGLASLFGEQEEAEGEGLEAHYRRTSEALEQARARLDTLDDYIDRISEVLGEPQHYLQVHTLSLRLNVMNIVVEANDPSGHDLRLTEVSLADERRRVIVPVCFGAQELPPQKDFLAGA